MRPSRAFTLIELMIAVALGSLVVYTAIAAVRVAAGSMTASQRMAIENQMLRIGVESAVDEADYWIGSDNPDDPAARPLRGLDPALANAGRPFTDFRDAGFLDSGNTTSTWSETRRGWSASPLAWSPADPRAWCRANVAEEGRAQRNGQRLEDGSAPRTYWGHFGIFSHLDGGRAWHTWYPNQIRGLIDAVGFYGLFEYLPSNGLAIYHGTQTPKGALVSTISFGGVPTVLTDNGQGTGLEWLCPSDGGDNTMKGRIRNSNGSRYFMPGPNRTTAAGARQFAKIGYEARDAGYGTLDASGTYQVEITRFVNNTRTGIELMRKNGQLVAPTHWPEATYRVHRFIERGHAVTLCVVEMNNPLTGGRVAIPFTTVATTLRGARQQRRPAPDYGWADPFSAKPEERRTLDYEDTP